MKINLEQAWREHFVLEEDMLEIAATCLTPKPVLEASVYFCFISVILFCFLRDTLSDSQI